MKVLLTFTGFHDPYGVGLVGSEEQTGPILSLIKESVFDKIFIFSTPNTEKNTKETISALASLNSHLVVERLHLDLEDPTDYLSILKSLRSHITEIIDATQGADYFISATSGTPQMHACWVLLAAGGEIPARILNVRPARFISRDRPLISEMDLTRPEFPNVRANMTSYEGTEDAPRVIFIF